MKTQTQADLDQILYPDDDGLPMSDNTLQFRWIVTLQGNLDALYRDNPEVFVAGNLLWYAVEGQPSVRSARRMVVFGRPKVYRGSYQQWREAALPRRWYLKCCRLATMRRNWAASSRFTTHMGWRNTISTTPTGTNCLVGAGSRGVCSPSYEWTGGLVRGSASALTFRRMSWSFFRPDNTPFLTFLQLDELQKDAQRQAQQVRQQADQAPQQADQECKTWPDASSRAAAGAWDHPEA